MKKIILFMLFLIPTFVTAVSIDCYNCSDCTAKLNQTYNVVKLDADIINHSVTCINNPLGFNNKTFDCQGHLIDGVKTTNTYGIYLNGKVNNTIKNCRIKNFYHGIYLRSSINHSIYNNTVNSNSRHGIYLRESGYNKLTQNTVNSNTHHGIYLEYGASSYNQILGNKANWNRDSGIFLQDADYNNIINNTANNNNDAGIYVDYRSRYNKIIDNKALFNKDGIYLGYESKYSTVTGNTANNNTGIGFYLRTSSGNNIINNSANSNRQGIHFTYGSNNNKIINNTINSNSNYGIYFYSSKDNTMTSNIINSNNDYGIYLDRYSKNTFKNNIINNNTYPLKVNGNSISDYYQDIDTSNTIDGKPIYYLTNEKDVEISELDNPSFVALVSSSNITVKNLIIQNNPHGILVVNTTDSRILNNTVNSNYENGIYLYYSSDNVAANNTANSNNRGIFLYYSSNNTLAENTARLNSQSGIHLLASINNSVNNNIGNSNDRYGIYLQNSQYNILSHNTVNNNDYHGIYLDFYYGRSDYNQIIGNTANSNKDNGIYLDNARYNDIINNTANNNNDHGIYLSGARYNDIINNTASSDAKHGIFLRYSSNNNVINNIADSNGDAGIYLRDSSNSNTVINNIADSNGVGIAVQHSSSNNNIINNAVSFNNYGIRMDLASNNNEVISNDVNSNNYGIELYGYSSNTIINNNINSNNYGVYLGGCSSAYGGCPSNNDIINNTINSNTLYGIYLKSSSHNNIINNSVNSNIGFETGTGLALYAGSNNNSIISNSINSNNIHGISLSDSSNNRLQENTILNNPVGIGSENSNSTINWNFVCYSILDFNSSNWLSSGDDNTCNEPDGWNDIGEEGCTYSCPGCSSSEDCLDDEFCNSTANECEDLSCLASFNHTCLDLNMTDAPITVSNLSEIYSANYSFVEQITVSNVLINTITTGNLSGIINMDYEIITIDTGSFAGKGFSKGQFAAVLDNISYSGDLKAVSYFDPSLDAVILNGVISGEITGIIDGQLRETVYDSGIYDNLLGTLSFNRLNNQIVSGELDLNGTINYQNSTTSTVGLYALQTSVQGTTLGHYTGAIETVVSHVSVINDSYAGEGFSIIFYISTLGSGQGYTYDTRSQGTIEMNGMFTDPLLGIVTATLDEATKDLSLKIERLDIGMPPMADLKVKLWTPKVVSPGQTFDFIIEYRNDGTKAGENVDIVLSLPDTIRYVSNTGGGVYKLYHDVIWHMGNISAQSKGSLSTTGTILWGLNSSSSVDTVVTIEEKEELQFDPTINVTLEFLEVTEQSLKMNLNLSNASESAGIYYEFNFTTVGQEMEPIINYTEDNESITFTADFTIEGGSWWWADDEAKARKEKLDKIKTWLEKAKETGEIYKGTIEQDKVLQCLRNSGLIDDDQYDKLKNQYQGVGYFKSVFNILDQAKLPEGAEEFAAFYSKAGVAAMEFGEKLANQNVRIELYDNIDEIKDMLELPPGFDPVEKVRSTEGLKKSIFRKLVMRCNLKDEEGQLSDSDMRLAFGFDPNVKYGPTGYVFAGQKLNYTVEFENVGNGSAFGVYFTDTLDEDLDDSTLELGPVIAKTNTSTNGTAIGSGTYNPGTRTITWRIWGGDYSQVGPKEGGYTNFNVSIRSNATSGTDITNYANIYFPSVPQVTPTNAIISIVTEHKIEGNGICSCSNCLDCTAALDDSSNCYNKVKLAADIVDQQGTCINGPENFNNKIFDCQGHTIDGNSSIDTYGIYLYNKTNNVIENCVISDMYKGIYLFNYSTNNILLNNTINSNWRGISSEYSSNNAITENTVNSNDNNGIYLSSSSDNVITNNTVNSNDKNGIYLSSSSNNNSINDNTVNSNNYDGIYLYHNSSFNKILNNKILNNTRGISISDCDPWGDWCPGGNTDNTIQGNEITDNYIGIYSQNSGSIINSNILCENSGSDLGSYDWLTTSGDENTCDNSGEWNDTGTTGCSYTCPIDFNLSLFKGWNLISIPVEIDNWVLPAPFSSIIGKYSNVFGFINGKWVEFKDNDEINETMGLWINMIDNSSLVLTGSSFDYELVLEQGWNLIGHPSTKETPINDSVYNGSVIYAYNNSWYSYIPSRAENALRYFTPGYGYWVKVG